MSIEIRDWVEYGKTFGEFRKEKLNQPGTIIVVAIKKREKGEEKQFMIGDVDPFGGCHGGCAVFEYSDIVLKYI